MPTGIRANSNGSKAWVNDHWESHPGVRSRHALTLGERAADFLKHWFGTWTALFSVLSFMAFWIIMQKTGAGWDAYPFILLNLCLSCVAAIQGIILQISANRGDRISAEVAVHTQDNTDVLIRTEGEILDLQHKQLELLDAIHELTMRVDTMVNRMPELEPGTEAASDADDV